MHTHAQGAYIFIYYGTGRMMRYFFSAEVQAVVISGIAVVIFDL